MDQRGMVPRDIGLARVTLEFDCLALWPVVGLLALATRTGLSGTGLEGKQRR